MSLEWSGGASGPSLGWPGLIWVSLGAHLGFWGVIRAYLHVIPCKEEALGVPEVFGLFASFVLFGLCAALFGVFCPGTPPQ